MTIQSASWTHTFNTIKWGGRGKINKRFFASRGCAIAPQPFSPFELHTFIFTFLDKIRSNQPDKALALLERMKADGLRMDRMTYGVMMFLHSRKGEWRECLGLNDQMEKVLFPIPIYSKVASL